MSRSYDGEAATRLVSLRAGLLAVSFIPSGIATGSPVNGTVEVGGPEKFRLDELVRRGLAAWKDPRVVVADPHARYYSIQLSERTLLPSDDARLGETRFETWLTQPAAKAAAVPH